MAFCTKCGSPVDASARFCPSCGAANAVSEPVGSTGATDPQGAKDNTGSTESASPAGSVGPTEPTAFGAGAPQPQPSATFNTAPPTPGSASAPNQVNTPLGNIDFSFNAATVGVADPQDVAANKGMAVLSYIIFFIPLIAGTHKTSPFVRFHVNQGTVLFVANLIYSVALTIILNILAFAIPWQMWSLFSIVSNLLRLVPLAFVILGVINAANGTLKQLPVIGGLSIIK